MTSRLSALLVALLLAAGPALGAEVVEQRFRVAYYAHDGHKHVAGDAKVPLLPDNACYYWYLRFAEPQVPFQLVERFELPVPLPDLAAAVIPNAGTTIEEGGRVAVTAISETSDDDGWVSHGWCAAEGDPVGRHVIDVLSEGVPIARYEFEVVAPEDYDFPKPLPPNAILRTADASW